MNSLSRRDFLKLGGLSIGSLAFSPALNNYFGFDDSDLVRVATNSVSIYSKPSDKSSIVSTWYRDELLRVYGEVVADEPVINPVWYRVWGGYVHRSHLQRVKVIYNSTLPSLEENKMRLVEVTVPFTQPWRTSKAYGWQPLGFRLYYGSVHWAQAIEAGPTRDDLRRTYDNDAYWMQTIEADPTGGQWYRVYDDLTGFPYHINPLHVRPFTMEELSPISPELEVQDKKIEVNLTTQTLIALEKGKEVLKTKIASGIPNGPRGKDGISTKTPQGEFRILDKMPAKHMGNGNLFADADDYELPGVPWTSFFTLQGHAFHGTYWHQNFGTPMSHGCINMKTEDAKWLFLWAWPRHEIGKSTNRGFGTLVEIYY